jgi:glycosyltransferase involved in cell wall biosynthesis
MREVYENPQKANELGLRSAEQARMFFWERMVESIKEELEQRGFL